MLPRRLAVDPASVWGDLSGPNWSTWLARAGQVVQTPVRGIGIEGAVLGKAIQARNGVPLLAMYYPTPSAAGEPFYSVLARDPSGEIRCFVFEYGVTEPGLPARVVMAEYRTLGDNALGDKGSQARIRYDVEGRADAQLLEFCLQEAARAVAPVASAPVASAPSAFEAAMAAANAASAPVSPSFAPPPAYAPANPASHPSSYPASPAAAPYRAAPMAAVAPTAVGPTPSGGAPLGVILVGGGVGILIVGAYLAWFLVTR